MAFDVKATLQAIESYLSASGYFTYVGVGERKAPPSGDGLSVDLWMKSAAVVRLYANGGTGESHVVLVRVYRDLFGLPTEETEFVLAKAVQQILSDLLGEYDLGTTVREIDAGGINGQPVRTDWGHVDIGGKLFRVADITIPLSVDDSATMVP